MENVLENIDIRAELTSKYNDGCGVTNAIPGGKTSTAVFGNEDVEEVLGWYEDEDYDLQSLWIYGKLKDGRYFVFSQWADYTFSGADASVADSKEDIERFGLDTGQRRKLGIVLPDIA